MDMKPSFFIVGAPRCGTTTLSRCLKNHPAICFSKPKEPHYFSKLDRHVSSEIIQAEYVEKYFSHTKVHHQAMGEGSPSYLYSPSGLQAILAFNPGAKFIVMVRNPVESVYSFHYRLVYLMQEDQRDFQKAWDLQEARAQGQHIPRLCHNSAMLQYGEVGQYGKYLEQLFEIAGPEKCKVVVFDDLKKSVLVTYKDVLTFLGLEYDGRTKFSHKMASRTYRFHWLNRMIWHPPTSIKYIRAQLEKSDLKKKKSLGHILLLKLKRLNDIKRPPPPMSCHMRNVLRESFSDDIDRLGRLLNRDLSHWKTEEALPRP
ncbi:MAG: sulfotransferase [Nitrospirales bacterium]